MKILLSMRSFAANGSTQRGSRVAPFDGNQKKYIKVILHRMKEVGLVGGEQGIKRAAQQAAIIKITIESYIFLQRMNICQQYGGSTRPESNTVCKKFDLFMKRAQSPLGETTKKISFDQGEKKRDSDSSINSKPTVGTEDREDREVEPEPRNGGGVAMTSILGSFLRKEKQLPNKSETVSPRAIRPSHSPLSIKPSQVPGYFLGARSTLKPQVKRSGMDRSNFHEKSPQDDSARVKTPNRSFNFSKREVKSSNEIPSGRSMLLLEQQNQILKEQNQLLKGELMEIKKQLIFGSPTKKEEIISNLRDTIKKEDAALREFKLKLDIANKKVSSLNCMLQTKDEEIQMLSNKVQSLQVDILQLKQKNNERYQSLKEKMVFVIRSFGELEKKFCTSEIEWMKFKEQWGEEKSIYLHRIQFLEGYISNNH